MFHKVKSVTPQKDFFLTIGFNNGETKIYDVKPLFEKIVDFKILLSLVGLFEEVKVAEGGYGVMWSDDLDLSCNELWNNGKIIEDCSHVKNNDVWDNFRIEMVKARNDYGVTQKELEALSGVRQPIIARMEKGNTCPQIDTILKILAPMGKTLAIIPKT